MRISEQWLREWVDVPAAIDDIAERLTMAGLEVDAIEDAAPALDGVVVGAVVGCTRHPDADKLKVCEVDLGEQQETIVCGAPNVAVGVRVPVATVGSELAGGLRIRAAKLRGVTSRGMLCSAAELGLARDAAGLWLLPDDAPVGRPLAAYLGLPDHVLDIDLTPNRGDCLSVRGIAREVALAFERPFVDAAYPAPPPVDPAAPEIAISAVELCPAYAGQFVDALRFATASPMWLRERLRRGGVRPINLPVDIGNYVMLELGQPMHAFDADKLVGGIDVRRARPGERIVTLDGQDMALSGTTLVIADAEGPVAIAGMIGGQRTAVDENTTRVLFESACFTPAAVAGQGRRYKIRTDALHRFERGVDPALHRVALARAVALLGELGGGRLGPVGYQTGAPMFAEDRAILLRGEQIERVLGQSVPAATVAQCLRGLGAVCDPEGEGHWRVTPPSWRYDLAIEADLIEEVARLYGYDRLQADAGGVELPPAAAAIERGGARAAEVLRQRGYHEAITYSFVDSDLQEAVTGGAPVKSLDNPISDAMAVMRRTLWPGLLEAWAYNTRRQQSRVRLYEQGLRFEPSASVEHGVAQIDTIAGLAAGAAQPAHWDAAPRAVDFFDVRGDVEALLGQAGRRLRFRPETHPALHPGRSARVYRHERAVGWLGQLSPDFAARYKGQDMPYLFELDRSALDVVDTVRYAAPSDQPRVARDLALVVPQDLPAGDLVDTISRLDLTLLQSVEVFDLFRGAELPAGTKSVALSLIFQDKTSTLNDESVDEIITVVTAKLREQCGARLRGE